MIIYLLRTLIITTIIINLINIVYLFDTTQFECAIDVYPNINEAIKLNNCTLFPSTHFQDYSQIRFFKKVNVTKKQDCCIISSSYQHANIFLIHQINKNKYQCNFYKSLTGIINLCTNDYLTVGIPAV
jgi:hypothetical protein